MGKKLIYEEVKKHIESFGYTLISKKYIDSKTKLLIQCPFGHEFEMKFNNFKSGQRCPTCAKKKPRYNKRLTYEYVYNFFAQFGYTLLSDTYETAHKKLKVMCPEGHIYEVKYANFYAGKRCPECIKQILRDKFSHSYDYVYNYIKSFGYLLLSDKYINGKELLLIQCPKGHNFYMCFNNFGQDQRCPVCAGNIKFTYEYVKEYIESFGYKLLSDFYENSNYQLLLIECSNGHQYETTFGNFRAGHRCNICVRENMRQENHCNWKGGISELNRHLRGLLYKHWVYDCLENCNFKCIITNLKYIKKDTLEVHHIYNFHKIVSDILNELKLPIYKTMGEYTFEEIKNIEELFYKYHTIKIGVPILNSLHTFYHKIYGDDNTPQQFKEFITRLRLGEFNNFLKENNLELNINYEILNKLLNQKGEI